ncbi:MAG: hypothetical protein JJLCMIEE_03021 [Acidimicrobiales bacterium]|nr:hypothetical protein [Acidimicrobiales bacterium]
MVYGGWEQLLVEAAHDDVLGPGVQWWASIGDRVSAGAVGTGYPGRPVIRTTRWPLFCLTKPVLGLAVGVLAGRNGITPDTLVGDIVPHGPAAEQGWRVADVLSHTAGISEPPLWQVLLSPPQLRPQLVLGAQPHPEFRPGKTSAYSEWAGAAITEGILTALSGQPAGTWVNDELLTPLGVEGLRFAAPGESIDAEGLGCYWLKEAPGEAGKPLLWFATPEFASQLGPAAGGIGSAESLGTLWLCVLHHLRSGRHSAVLGDPALLRNWLAWRRAELPDVVLGRNCAFGLGMTVDLAGHGFGSGPGAAAFAHTGWMGGMDRRATPTVTPRPPRRRSPTARARQGS